MGNVVARTENLATEAIDDGLLVYDLSSNDAHWLDAAATEVWRLADGSRTADEIALTSGLAATDVHAALTKLIDLGLIADTQPNGVTRRLMIRKVAVTAGIAAAAGPIIKSIVAPTNVSAQTMTQTCDATACSGSGNGGHVQGNADAVCQSRTTAPSCRSTSRCNCTITGTGSNLTCSGTCVF